MVVLRTRCELNVLPSVPQGVITTHCAEDSQPRVSSGCVSKFPAGTFKNTCASSASLASSASASVVNAKSVSASSHSPKRAKQVRSTKSTSYTVVPTVTPVAPVSSPVPSTSSVAADTGNGIETKRTAVISVLRTSRVYAHEALNENAVAHVAPDVGPAPVVGERLVLSARRVGGRDQEQAGQPDQRRDARPSPSGKLTR